MAADERMSDLTRRVAQLEEIEIRSTVERHAAHAARHGILLDPEAMAENAAYERHRRRYLPDADVEAQIEHAARWWADRTGFTPEEIIAEAERVADECDESCPAFTCHC